MYNDTLNHLKTEILPTEIRDCDRLKIQFQQHLQMAVSFVVANDYVEDCLFQIDEALDRFCQSRGENLEDRIFLLGAIEALRDELHLCHVDADIRQTASGF